jgi:hypothetical protein
MGRYARRKTIMTVQLPLPAAWATTFSTRPDPIDELDQLARDKLDAKAEIRQALDRLAEKHHISPREVNAAVTGYVDDLLSDAAYELERELTRQIEERDSI